MKRDAAAAKADGPKKELSGLARPDIDAYSARDMVGQRINRVLIHWWLLHCGPQSVVVRGWSKDQCSMSMNRLSMIDLSPGGASRRFRFGIQ